MIRAVDISNWQSDCEVSALQGIGCVICKATEGASYVDRYCDGFYQDAKSCGLLRGFYHFAGGNGATAEADFFIDNTEGYFNDGVPILDWEGNQSVAWVNEFVNRVHDRKGVWPIIYANPWRFDQGGVEPNCARWVASYPNVAHPSFDDAEGWSKPDADGNVVGWQFCSDGRVSGYGGDLDCSLFYMDEVAWGKYAGAAQEEQPPADQPNETPSEAPAEEPKKKYTVTGTFEVTEE